MQSDVCLVLEGTYPYVAGGVSSWVYSLIKEMPDIDFSIVYIGAHRSALKKRHYDLPHNVVDFREIYLFDYSMQAEKLPPRKKEDYDAAYRFLRGLKKMETGGFADMVRVAGNAETRTLSLNDFAHSFGAWSMIEKLYQEEREEVSFVDFFWTWRFIYLPLISLLRVTLPEARVYHSVSTGYAGVIGALCKLEKKRPFLLTEHGIYTRERKIEISKADWIYSEMNHEIKVLAGKDYFKDWWTCFSVL